MPVNHETVGVWYAPATADVSADGILAYADACNDPNPAYRKGDDSIAPPLYPIVSGWNAMAPCMADTLSGDMLMMLVHLIQDMRFTRPVRAGDKLTNKGRVFGIEGSERGTKVTSQVVYTDPDGALVGEFFATIYVRGHGGEPSSGDAAPSVSLTPVGDPVATVSFAIDADQTNRYSEASGDFNPIHLDNDFATSVGLPGIINHGMNTLAQAAWAFVENVASGDPVTLKRFAGRFSKPVLPGQTLTSRIYATANKGVYCFEVDGPDGAVIKDGVAEIA